MSLTAEAELQPLPTTAKTTTTSVEKDHTNDGECVRLAAFKEFLDRLVSALNVESGEGVEVRSCMTRHSNETYPLTLDELHAEVLMTIWNYLQSKQCPKAFILPLMQTAVKEIEPKCRNAKDGSISAATNKINDKVQDSVDAPQFDLMKLQKFIISNLEGYLTRLTDNAEAGNLRNYGESSAVCKKGVKCNCGASTHTESSENSFKRFVAGSIKNKPRKMEDRHVCLERFSEMYDLKKAYSFYGVFDGHSGPLAASYTACQLPFMLAKNLQRLEKAGYPCEPEEYREAFESSFLLADKFFCQKLISSGTTAVCALISANNCSPAHLYLAWVGDSKALLVSPTVSLQLVKPHKPDSPEERKRIEESDSGGTVMYAQGHWRVNGILNVSRSIGDYSVGAAIAEPDIVDVTLMSAHDFLVLGTDGLWDHVPETLVVETIYQSLANEELQVEDIPKQLIELAKQGDSQDNITVVIVFLKMRSQIVANFRENA